MSVAVYAVYAVFYHLIHTDQTKLVKAKCNISKEPLEKSDFEVPDLNLYLNLPPF